MLTYVINTSENRTFSSDLLFEMAGYDQIVWMSSPLDKIHEHAKEIFERQNRLDAGEYRVAVIIDFFGYRLIPVTGEDFSGEEFLGEDLSGDGGGTPDETAARSSFSRVKVTAAAYKPFLEAYLDFHLFGYLMRRNRPPKEREVYYIQSPEEPDGLNFADMKIQVAKIFGLPDVAQACRELSAPRVTVTDTMTEKEYLQAAGEQRPKDWEPLPKDNALRVRREEFVMQTAGESRVVFHTGDYCKGTSLSFDDFYSYVRNSLGGERHIRRVVYHNSGLGSARAAFDTLNLSLYLVHMSENNKARPEENAVLSHRENARLLRETMEDALARIDRVRSRALFSDIEYYQLDIPSEAGIPETDRPGAKDTPQALIGGEGVFGAALPEDAENCYEMICQYADHRVNGRFRKEEKEAFDKMFFDFLSGRDNNSQSDMDERFREKKENRELVTDKKLPTKENLEGAVRRREEKIAGLLTSALGAEAVMVDYSQEKKEADARYDAYCQAKKSLQKSVGATALLAVLSVLSMLIPFAALFHGERMSVGFAIGCVATVGIFTGLFLLSLMLYTLPLKAAMAASQRALVGLCRTCIRKHEASFADLRRRYNEDLPAIESLRYEIRQIYYLHHDNCRKDKNVQSHKAKLEEVADHLRSILNHMGHTLQTAGRTEDGEADGLHIELPPEHPENTIYQIFTKEFLEEMFAEKGEQGK